MTGIIVLRLVVFVLLWFAGFDCWILPNMFNEDCGIIDSFIPAYSVGFIHQKPKDYAFA